MNKYIKSLRDYSQSNHLYINLFAGSFEKKIIKNINILYK